MMVTTQALIIQLLEHGLPMTVRVILQAIRNTFTLVKVVTRSEFKFLTLPLMKMQVRQH